MGSFVKTKFLSWKKFESHTLVIDSRTNKQVHKLNEVGAFLWNSLDELSTKEELVNSLVERYEIDQANAKMDVDIFIESLLEKGLVNE